jgi:hypothetical protein
LRISTRHRWHNQWPLLVGVLLAVMVLLPVRSSIAKLEIKGHGKAMVLVRNQFSAEMQPRYGLFAKRCTKCHDMARPIAALRTGITPVTGTTFDRKAMKKYAVKMMRKPNSGITKSAAREILLFIMYARKLALE